MKRLLLAFFLVYSFYSYSQDSLLTFSRILNVEGSSKTELYDKAMIWCSKSFNESKSAINVREKESGIIAGKALLNSFYKIPKKKDSVTSMAYTEYLFDWLIEVKDSKARFSVKNIIVKEFSGDYPVTVNGKPPIKYAFTSAESNLLIWELAKKALINNINLLASSLYTDLIKKDNW